MDWQNLGVSEVAEKTQNLIKHLCDCEFPSVANNSLILWWHLQRTKSVDNPDDNQGTTK